ncbi:MAG TPA: efflux RND transporter periplasmic adaptor subunit [Planctomycetota bacterium]|nr:efflux RND transporter periplasmic adaptor subunit [Planctomycetota bacterium]
MNAALETPKETPAVATKTRKPAVFLLLAVVAAAALAVIGILPRLERRAALDAAKSRVEAGARVSVVAPRPAPNEVLLTLPGGTQAIQEATLYARTSGFLSQRKVDIGDRVEAGQLLAVIESPELDQELERAVVRLDEARANVTLAQSTLQRIATLIKTHAVSEQEYDDQKVRVNSAEASVKAGEADVRRLSALQSYEKVVAPFAGTITARNVDKGALVTSGSGSTVSSLFSIADTSGLRVFIDVPQNAAPGVTENQEAEVLVRELPKQVFRGSVVRTARALDPSTRTLRTELFLPNPDGVLLPGMYVQVKLTVHRENPGVLIPARTLVLRKEGPRVVVVGAGKRAELRSVKLGRDFGAEIEVLTGLDGKEQLVENPTDDLETGQLVRVESAQTPPTGTRLANAEKNK